MLSLVPILTIGLSVLSGTDTTRTRWTLGDYLALVEAANPELAVARERAAAAQARIGPAGRPADPMIELGLMNRSLPRFGRNSPVAMDQIRVAQSLPTPGKLGAATSAAKERADGEGAQVEEVRLMLRWRATDLFVELDRVDRTLALLRQSGPVLRALEDVARARYSVGEGQQADVLRAQLETARLAEELVMLESDRRSMVARLNALALRAPSAPIDTVELPPVADSTPALGLLTERAGRDRPLLAVRRSARQAAGFDRRRAELERWPEVEVGLAYAQQPMFGGTGTDRMMSVTLGASLPIWSGSRQRQMRREAEAMERMAAADVDALRAETEARLGELVSETDRAARLGALYAGTLLPQTRITAASALSGYRTGGIDFETAMTGQLAVIRAEIEAVRLGAARVRALAEIEYLTTVSFAAAGGSR